MADGGIVVGRVTRSDESQRVAADELDLLQQPLQPRAGLLEDLPALVRTVGDLGIGVKLVIAAVGEPAREVLYNETVRLADLRQLANEPVGLLSQDLGSFPQGLEPLTEGHPGRPAEQVERLIFRQRLDRPGRLNLAVEQVAQAERDQIAEGRLKGEEEAEQLVLGFVSPREAAVGDGDRRWVVQHHGLRGEGLAGLEAQPPRLGERRSQGWLTWTLGAQP